MATSAQDPVPATAPSENGCRGRAGPERPLASYGLLTAVFTGAFAGALFAGRRRLPERIDARDLALLSVGTYKLSRLIAKDRVTSAVRAPFTRFQDDAGPAEVEEAARGHGLRRALGELLVCPYCLDQWVAGSSIAGIVLAPRATRTVASMFAVAAGADVLQHGYRLMQENA